MKTKTHPRHIEHVLRGALGRAPVVYLLGPRRAGKSTLVKQIAPRRKFIDLENDAVAAVAQNDPASFVDELSEYVALGEMQSQPDLVLPIKKSVDRNQKPGRFLITGSADLRQISSVRDSLAGRVEVINLNPLCEQEKHRSPYSLLESIVSGKLKPSIGKWTSYNKEIAAAIVAGGFPEAIRLKNKTNWFKNYLKAITRRDVNDIAKVRKADAVYSVLRCLARNTGKLINVSNIANEIQISRQTVEDYIRILEHLYLVRRLPAWYRTAAKTLVSTPKINMVDSGLASYLCNCKPEDWHNPDGQFGYLLDNFVVQQLISQAGWINEFVQFFHYRDRNQVEVHLVIQLGRSVWGVEIKKSASLRPADGAGLRRLATVAGRNWQGGVLLYLGCNCFTWDKARNISIVPIGWLWKK